MELNDLDHNLNKISKSIEENSSKSVFIKEKYIIQQKILNHLIDIYQTKAKYQTPKAKETKKTIRYKSTLPLPLPSIQQTYPLSPVTISQRDEKEKPKISILSPKDKKKKNQKDKLKHLKDLLTKRANHRAKEEKEHMLILKDNLFLYKDNLRLENINRRNLVITKKKIMDESILNYKQYKKSYIDLMNSNDILQLNEENTHKRNELAFWKKQTEEKLSKANSMGSLLFMTQHNHH